MHGNATKRPNWSMKTRASEDNTKMANFGGSVVYEYLH